MANPSNSAVQNLLPVQAYFDAQDNFITFIGQGKPFYATSNPVQSGLTITNSTLNSSPIGGTSPSTGVFTNIATTTGTISTNASSATDIVNLLTLQSYAAGISWKNPVTAATTTNITLSGLQTVDTVSLVAGNTVLVKNQTDNTKNGIYTVSAGAWTYATGSTTWAQYVSALVFVEYGTQAGSAWYCSAQPGGTLGTTAMVWSNFSVASTYTAGTGLTLAGYQFSITNTGVAANTYGSATASPVFAVNAQGQITSVTNTTITPAIGNVTGLATGIATFLQTPTSANLAAAVSDETGSGSLVFATSPTLVTPALGTPASGVMTNVTGLPLSTGVTGTLPIGNGGTGQTTASTAFNALSPITTAGDLIIGNGTNSATRLGIGSNNYVLTSNGTTASWAAVPSSMVYPGAGIPNSTGSAWGTSYSTTGSGTVVALATSPVFVTPTLGAASATSISTSGTETAGAFVANKVITGSLNAGAFSYGTLAYSDIDIFSSYTLSVNNYVQKILQNTNSGTAASADFVISNNLGTASTYYGDFGITSSGYNTPGQNITNTPNTVYLQAVTTGLAIGTLNANTTTFYSNSTQSAQISTAGVWSLVNDASIHGLAIGLGNGSVAYNTALGDTALGGSNSGSSGQNTAVGYHTLYSNTSGSFNSAFGCATLQANTTGTNNTASGQNALYTNTTGSYNSAFGFGSLFSNTTANNNVAVGYQSMYANTTGAANTALGTSSFLANTTGSNNVALGFAAMESNTTGSYNVAIGRNALDLNTTGSNNTAIGYQAAYNSTTSAGSTVIGYQAGYSATTNTLNNTVFIGYQAGYYQTGASNTAIGYSSFVGSTTPANNNGYQNTAIGQEALKSNTTASNNTAVGYQAMQLNTTGTQNTAIGMQAMISNTTGNYNVAIGGQDSTTYPALYANTTGASNVAVGNGSLGKNTTASNNTAIGYQAGYSCTAGGGNTFLGYQAGYTFSGGSGNTYNNTCVGIFAGYTLGSGVYGNSFIGSNAGKLMTTGLNNTILGAYSGNQGGLDIRTSNNYIVLSDGDGNPRLVGASNSSIRIACENYASDPSSTNYGVSINNTGTGSRFYGQGTGTETQIEFGNRNGARGSIQTNSTVTLYNTTSDYRLKEDVIPMVNALNTVSALKPCTYIWKIDGSAGQGFIAHELAEVVPDCVSGEKDAVNEDGSIKPQCIDTSFLVATLTAAIQELNAKVTALEAQLGTK